MFRTNVECLLRRATELPRRLLSRQQPAGAFRVKSLTILIMITHRQDALQPDLHARWRGMRADTEAQDTECHLCALGSRRLIQLSAVHIEPTVRSFA